VKETDEERGGYGEKVRLEAVERDGKKGGRRDRERRGRGGSRIGGVGSVKYLKVTHIRICESDSVIQSALMSSGNEAEQQIGAGIVLRCTILHFTKLCSTALYCVLYLTQGALQHSHDR
jgi:hypothetical protein